VPDAREELIRDIFERWNAGEREIDTAAVDPDAVVHSAMTNTSYTGYEGIRRWIAEMRIFSGHERALEAAGLPSS
jgi:hypothetical protein